jgi:hypothetical protein
VLRRLLERGLDPNERMQLGQLEEQTFSSGGPLLEAVNTGRIDMARVLLAHGADPNASVYTAGSATAAAYNGGSPPTHAPDQAMIDLMVQHGGWIDAGGVGYMRNVELARRMLHGEVDPHLESGTVEEAILWGGASGRSAEIVRMALERINWPRDDPRWFWLLWRPLPGHRDLNEAEQADSRATFRLILERCDPNLRAPESGQTMLHEVIARPWSRCVSRVHPAGCGRALGRARRVPEEYAPRVGVPLGPCGAGQTAAGSRGRSDRA